MLQFLKVPVNDNWKNVENEIIPSMNYLYEYSTFFFIAIGRNLYELHYYLSIKS